MDSEELFESVDNKLFEDPPFLKISTLDFV